MYYNPVRGLVRPPHAFPTVSLPYGGHGPFRPETSQTYLQPYVGEMFSRNNSTVGDRWVDSLLGKVWGELEVLNRAFRAVGGVPGGHRGLRGAKRAKQSEIFANSRKFHVISDRN